MKPEGAASQPMSAARARTVERAVLRRVADLALLPPTIRTGRLPDYGLDRLDYAMNVSVERTPGGRVWALWVAGEDGPGAFMVAASSDDGGETWSPPRLAVDGRSPRTPLPRSVIVGALWTDPSGRLWLFFDQVMHHWDGRGGLWAAVCDNPDADEPAWTPPRRIWHGSALNKPIVRSTGEWMLPVQLLEIPGFGPFREPVFSGLDPLRGANVLVSSDAGETWTLRGGRKLPHPNWPEHHLVEKRDGTLWMLARTKSENSLVQCFSGDGGVSWSPPASPPNLAHVVSRFHVRRLASGRILLVKHGAPTERIPGRGRERLQAFLSADEGATWHGGLMLDDRSEVSYPDGTQAPDGTILVTYDRNRATDAEILMARFTEEDVMAGRPVSPGARLRGLVVRCGDDYGGRFQ